MCIRDILEAEVASAGGGEIAVLVSGPEEMASEVRNTVGQIVRKGSGVKVRLYVESFSW